MMKYILFSHGFGKSNGIYHRLGRSHSSTIRLTKSIIIGKIYFHGESETETISIDCSIKDFKNFVREHCW
jgi:hypothetical protein